MSDKHLPTNTLVVIATGAEANLYRNVGQSGEIHLKADGSLTPKNLADEGSSGVRPPESSQRSNDEATFSKQLAEHRYKMAHAGKFSDLVIAADPTTLGELRPMLHQEVTDKIVVELNKTLINSSSEEIVKSIKNAL